MRDFANERSGRELNFALGLSVIAISAALAVSAASAQEGHSATVAPAAQPARAPVGGSNAAQKAKGPYYVDFRARTAASYGHAFVWYGRVGVRAVEVAGLHPATDSVVPYIIGHVLPVPSETGASYGDLDEEYLTASYRVYLSEAKAKEVFAYIKHLQATSPVWNAALYNCISFISDIAKQMGLRTPASHLFYPEDWVNELRALNSGAQPAQARVARSAQARAARSAQPRRYEVQ